jgi:hypothetical protein
MCGSATARLLGLWVRIPPRSWMSVSCECCVLSGRGLCVELITCPDEFYRVWCVWVWSWSLDNKKALAQKRAVAPWGEKLTRTFFWILLLCPYWIVSMYWSVHTFFGSYTLFIARVCILMQFCVFYYCPLLYTLHPIHPFTFETQFFHLKRIAYL